MLRRQLSNLTRRVARQPTTVASDRGGDSGAEHISFIRTGRGACEKGRDGRSGWREGCLAPLPPYRRVFTSSFASIWALSARLKALRKSSSESASLALDRKL